MNARTSWLVVFACTLACSGAGAASFPVNHAVPDAQLDTIRGGFDLGDNLKASFALQRTVFVNGMEALNTTISVPDIANITRDQATALQNALRTTVITNGAGGISSQAVSTTPALASGASASAAAAGNTAAQAAAATPSAASAQTSSAITSVLPGSALPGLIVQNSLNNQAITANTTIDASVNTAQMVQNMRAAESIKDAVIQFRGN